MLKNSRQFVQSFWWIYSVGSDVMSPSAVVARWSDTQRVFSGDDKPNMAHLKHKR